MLKVDLAKKRLKNMIKCMKCGAVDAIAKSGIIRGKQRYYCKSCDYYFTLQSPDETKD